MKTRRTYSQNKYHIRMNRNQINRKPKLKWDLAYVTETNHVVLHKLLSILFGFSLVPRNTAIHP